MPRPKRDKTAGRFHVYAHSVWAAPALFGDDVDRSTFVRELARTTARVEWTCVAFCLLKTHYHLLLDVSDETLPRGMHALNFRYACMFNGRHAMKGHVFGARYGARRIEDDDDLMTVYSYIASNPVEAGLCRAAEEWAWSSHPGTVGWSEASSFVDPRAVVDCFDDGDRDVALERLRRFVDKA